MRLSTIAKKVSKSLANNKSFNYLVKLAINRRIRIKSTSLSGMAFSSVANNILYSW